MVTVVVPEHCSRVSVNIGIQDVLAGDPEHLPHTGDPHASERIGPSCSRTQTGVSLGELVAALKGADLNEVNTLNEQVHQTPQSTTSLRLNGSRCG